MVLPTDLNGTRLKWPITRWPTCFCLEPVTLLWFPSECFLYIIGWDRLSQFWTCRNNNNKKSLKLELSKQRLQSHRARVQQRTWAPLTKPGWTRSRPELSIMTTSFILHLITQKLLVSCFYFGHTWYIYENIVFYELHDNFFYLIVVFNNLVLI